MTRPCWHVWYHAAAGRVRCLQCGTTPFAVLCGVFGDAARAAGPFPKPPKREWPTLRALLGGPLEEQAPRADGQLEARNRTATGGPHR